MGEFLKGWRRMAGCVTLVMACVLTMGWVRSLYPHLPSPLPSQFVFDEQSWKFAYFFPRVDHAVDRLALKDSCLIWEKIEADAPIMVSNVIGVWFNATDANFPDLEIQSNAWTSYREWCGFAIGRFHLREGRFDLRIARLVLPFWSIVTSLTLLSAYLLLSKLRPGKLSLQAREC
jgi:hypothetical protein